MKSRLIPYTLEISKWVLVIFLMYPLITTFNGKIDFVRVVVGEALLIIFIGKLFYDTIIWKFTRSQRAAGQDLLAMVGMIVAIGFILIMFFLLVGITVLKYFQSQANPIIGFT